MFELCLTLVWSYLMLAMALLWLVHFILPVPALAVVSSPFLPYGTGILLGATCLIQFALSKWMDSRYEPHLGKLFLDDLVSIGLLANHYFSNHCGISKSLTTWR